MTSLSALPAPFRILSCALWLSACAAAPPPAATPLADTASAGQTAQPAPRPAAATAVATSSPVQPGPAAAAATARPAPTAGAPVIIDNDKGGHVLSALARRNQLAASGRPVEIRGYCRSACTMFITLPNACLAPDATVGFHAPRIANTQVIPPIVDRMMAAHYRNGVLERWNAEWRHSLKMTRISAREYVALDPETRLCPR